MRHKVWVTSSIGRRVYSSLRQHLDTSFMQKNGNDRDSWVQTISEKIPFGKKTTHMQAIRQKRSVTIPTKTAVKAMRRFPSLRSRVSVAPITLPLDQLTQVPR